MDRNPPRRPDALSLEPLTAAHRRRLVAHLARSLGLDHLAPAEDAVHTAVQRALERWPTEGTPANPAGWLYRVARNEAIDTLRAAGRLAPWPDDDEGSTGLALPDHTPAGRFAGELDDDELALVFAACHPALPAASQVALALRALAGLELDALSAVLLCTPAALAQRLARARQLLSDHARELRDLPAGSALPPRRDAVLTTLSLIFHAGMQAAARQPEAGPDGPLALCWEAIRLARALAAHPAVAHGDADALAALLLLHGARLTGRVDEAGEIVPLPGQPRDRWDAGMVRMGLVHLQASQRAAGLSRWHLLAGIAAEHALAPDYAATDWPAIVRYYDMLVALDGSPAPRLGHAIALAEAGATGPAQVGLRALLPGVPAALRPHTLAALARACERAGDMQAARQGLDQAIACALHPADARMLQRRRAALPPT